MSLCEFEEIARLPLAGDNVAIANQRLEAGTQIRRGAEIFSLDWTVMEGHRFAVQPIPVGQFLRSWGLPFGRAIEEIAPGTYVCNQGMLEALRERDLDFALPDRPNFEDWIEPYLFDEARFIPGQQVEPSGEARTFAGYERGPERGAGTRNYLIVLGTSSRTAGYARLLVARLQDRIAGCRNVDGAVAVDHTEGGGKDRPSNLEWVLRTLAGFLVHPNVAAALAVDYGTEGVTNRMLQEYMAARGYPLKQVLHRFVSLTGSLERHLEEGERQLLAWLALADGMRRSEQPLSRLKIALQCGGSDAFSGISGNPLAAWVAREVICHGGSANLAETDELIGAESYLLRNVRDAATARQFLKRVERFRERVAWHGESAEGNPSGGNRFRGLYNIALKSIGAAMKRHPEVRLDYVIDYAEPMRLPGYYFMDSPGNDLESIAGQVAAGCNLIFFITGNGSVTNFPFVPTLKIITTTARYELLSQEMDVNAGAYQDGTPLEELGRRMFALTLETASGVRSKGERAGHAQVQLWRAWPQQDGSCLKALQQRPEPAGRPLTVPIERGPEWHFTALDVGGKRAVDQVGLILPTSLCSAQIARLAADRLNALGLGRQQGLSRFVALVHTEGCGVAGGDSEAIYNHALLGYLTHPLVRCALILEHGCEKSHNDYVRRRLAERNLNPDLFGWASVQQDGGIERVLAKIESWFCNRLATLKPLPCRPAGLEAVSLGLLSAGPLPSRAACGLACLSRWVVGAGGTVVVPENAELLRTPEFLEGLRFDRQPGASLAYGQTAVAGFHVMETPTDHWVETSTGLGATGVQLILAHLGEHPLPGHPLVPLVQISAEPAVRARYAEDLDLFLACPNNSNSGREEAEQLLALLGQVASRQHRPRAAALGNVDFQLTRGRLGVSM